MTRNETKVWNRFSGIYDIFMKKDIPAYGEMIERIKKRLEPKSRVLEIATGTGILSLGIAGSARSIEAIDLSPDMIARSQNKAQRMGIANVHFSVQDAYALPYDEESYDVVIIANTLHIMPQPEKALAEIKRVLTTEGYLIAPTFVHAGSKKAAVLSRLMTLTGFRAYHRWTQSSFRQFLRENGFVTVEETLLDASFPLAYVVCNKAEK